MQAREEAEHQCREDEQRIAELKQLHQQLEQLLELERQAKRDEEIVRSLQAKYVPSALRSVVVSATGGELCCKTPTVSMHVFQHSARLLVPHKQPLHQPKK